MPSLDTRQTSAPARPIARPGSDVFDRARFFLRQKHFSLQESYFVWGENETKLLFVERPRHHARSFLSLFGAVAALLFGGILGFVVIRFALALFIEEESAEAVAALSAMLCGVAAAFVTGVALSAKRHVSFYRDESKAELLLQVEQDAKFQVLSATYTVKDPAGTVLARLSKRLLADVFRKHWTCHDRGGALVCTIKEDSILKSILRRLIGPLAGLLRTNFLLLDGAGEIGRFDRQLTLFDRYVLDVSKDTRGVLDRRVALAIGVMLDTGERR